MVQHGLDLLRHKAEEERLEHAALKTLLEERLASPFVSAEEMRRRVGALAAGRAGSHATE